MDSHARACALAGTPASDITYRQQLAGFLLGCLLASGKCDRDTYDTVAGRAIDLADTLIERLARQLTPPCRVD